MAGNGGRIPLCLSFTAAWNACTFVLSMSEESNTIIGNNELSFMRLYKRKRR